MNQSNFNQHKRFLTEAKRRLERSSEFMVSDAPSKRKRCGFSREIDQYLRFHRAKESVSVQYYDCNIHIQSYDDIDLDAVAYYLVLVIEYLNVMFHRRLKLHAELYLTPVEKTFTIEKGLTRHNVNSAYTNDMGDKDSIFMFRYEEWLKVWFHECLHNYRMILRTSHKIISPYEINTIMTYRKQQDEAYIEFLAQTYFATMVCVDYNHYKQYHQKTMRHTELQLNSILYHYDVWEESTGAFGYYFLRYLLQKNNIWFRDIQVTDKELDDTLFSLRLRLPTTTPIYDRFSLRMTPEFE